MKEIYSVIVFNQKYSTIFLTNIDSSRLGNYFTFAFNTRVLAFALFIIVTDSYLVLMSFLNITRNKGLIIL